MEKENKIIKYIKENYKLMIPIALLAVIFIAAIVYYKVTVFDNYTKETDVKAYEWAYDEKYEFTMTISENRRKEIVDVVIKDRKLHLDSTPVYYQEEEKVIFPSNMSVVMPTLNCAEYYANRYSSIRIEKGNTILTTEKYSNRLGHYFLYNGYDLYFFLDDTKLIAGSENVNLSPLSYVIAKQGKYISYYDKKTDVFKTLNVTSNDIVVENNYYKIYIMTDTIDYYGTNVILTGKIDELNPIKMKDNL